MHHFLSVSLFLFATSLAQAKTWEGHSGPWGDLLISSMYLEAPDAVIDVIPKPNSVTRWTFPNNTPSGLKSLFIRLGVSGALVESLTSAPKLVVNGADILIYPSIDDLLKINGGVRDALYAEIAKYEQNEHHFDPVYILSDNVEEWLEKADLSKSQKNIFRQLV